MNSLYASSKEELKEQNSALTKELQKTHQKLIKSKNLHSKSEAKIDTLNRELLELRKSYDRRAPTEEPQIQLGPITIGGAMRVSYVYGTYITDNNGDGHDRGSNGGNVEMDTFRINMTLLDEQWIGAFEYRWYNDFVKTYPASYSFIHTAWLGYRFNDSSHIEIGINRVPFGAGDYGVAQSYMFDMHYYLGLADDMDLGVKYVTKIDNFHIDIGYYISSEGSYAGWSNDSTRYSFDAVRWNESVNNQGEVVYGGIENGFDERNQINLRVINSNHLFNANTQVGTSLQYGQLHGINTEDGDHWAASLHMVNDWDGLKLGTQISRYEYHINRDNPWQSDALIPMGAFDFAWFAASKAWISALSLSLKQDMNSIAWIDSILPYIEYSHVYKDEPSFNDSQMLTIGSQFYRGNWLVYIDLAMANGNWFIGNETEDGKSDNYNKVDGVGDWGANGNNHWNTRLTINFGYYF